MGVDELAVLRVRHHRRVHAGRMHRVHPNTVRGKLFRVDPHETDDTVLGGAVPDLTGEGVQPDTRQAGRRTRDDDRPALPPFDEVRHRHLEHVPYTGEHGVDRVVPCLALFTGADHRHDAGVRQHDVDLPELCDARVVGPLDILDVADVADGRDDRASGLLDLPLGLSEVVAGRHRIEDRGDLAADVHRDDGGPLFGEPDGVRASLASRRTGDESDLAFESTHECSPSDCTPRLRAGKRPCVERSEVGTST
ncbi:hypothetical protein AIIKEEIJ_04805 [Rhodococcus sp. YH1]|nr:hypothetical protein [Rhodococcus sp. YH1]